MARISTSASASPTKRGRGRPPKNANAKTTTMPPVPSTPTKKSLPGRPKKSTAIEDIAAEEGLGPIVSPRKSRNADKPALASDVAPSAAPAARTSPRKTATAPEEKETNGDVGAGASTYRGRGRPRKSDGKTATKTATKTDNPALNRVKSGRVGRPPKNASAVAAHTATRATPKRMGRPPKASNSATTANTTGKAKTSTRGRIGRPSKHASASALDAAEEESDEFIKDFATFRTQINEQMKEVLTVVKRNTVDRAKLDKLVAANASMQAELLELRGTVSDLGIDAAAVEQRLDHVEEFLATEMNMEVDVNDSNGNTNGNNHSDADVDEDEIDDVAQANGNHLPIPTLVINGALLDGGQDIEIDVVPNVQVVATQESGSNTQLQPFSTAEEDAAMLDEDFIDDGDEEEQLAQANGADGDGNEEDGPLGPANPKAQSIFGSVFSAVQERLSSPGRGASSGR